jgi:hypothetical protein
MTPMRGTFPAVYSFRPGAYYDQQRARGHTHRQALRALGAKWLKIIFVMWQRQVPYDEQYHLATMTRQQLGQRQKEIA